MLSHGLESDRSMETGAHTAWSPEQQTAHLLDLCEAQMEAALQESDSAVDALVHAFTCMAETAHSLNSLATRLPPSAEQLALDDLGAHCEEMTKHMASAIVAIQFYDKLTQRLGHVRYSLSTLAMFVCDRNQTAKRDQWKNLFTALRRLYRTEAEREIFQLVTEGMSAEQARLKVQKLPVQASAGGDIELF